MRYFYLILSILLLPLGIPNAASNEQSSSFSLERLEESDGGGWAFRPLSQDAREFVLELPVDEESSGLLLEMGRLDDAILPSFAHSWLHYAKSLFKEGEEDFVSVFINQQEVASRLLISDLAENLRFSAPVSSHQIYPGAKIQVRLRFSRPEVRTALRLAWIGYQLDGEGDDPWGGEVPEFRDVYTKEAGKKGAWIRQRKLDPMAVSSAVPIAPSESEAKSSGTPPIVGRIAHFQRSDGIPALMGLLLVGPAPSDPDGGRIVSIAWDFGDGVETVFAPHELNKTYVDRFYRKPGLYTVRATVTDDQGDSTTVTKKIRVADNQRPSPVFDVDKMSGRVPLTVTFSAEGEDRDGSITNYWWEFGDGSPRVLGRDKKSVTHTFSERGVYRVRLRTYDNNLGKGESYANIYAGVAPPRGGSPPFPVIQTSPIIGRTPLTVEFDAERSFDIDGRIASVSWKSESSFLSSGEWKQGKQVEYVFKRPGTHIVKVRVRDEEGRYGNKHMSIHVLEADGSVSRASRIVALPQDTPGRVYFDWELESRSLQTESWRNIWNFGDGTRGMGHYQTKTYDSPGTYTVKLSSTDVFGRVHRTSQVLDLTDFSAFPKADFSITPSFQKFTKPVVYDASASTSGIAGDDSLSFLWSDSQGLSSSESRVVQRYSSPGDTEARLIVTNSRGLSHSLHKEHRTWSEHSPWPRFTLDPQVCSAPCEVTARVLDPQESYSYAWDFGDGTMFLQRGSASYDYTEPGHHWVRMIMRDLEGRDFSHYLPVWILDADSIPENNAAPTVDFSFALEGDGSDPKAFLFTPNASDSDGHILSYKWDFGYGSFEYADAARPIGKRFEEEGDYPVRLTVIDNHGKSVSVSKVVQVRLSPPAAGFSVSRPNFENPRELRFQADENRDSLGKGLPVVYNWDFGDGNGASGKTPTHVYATSGPFTVTLTVTDVYGRNSQATREIAGLETNASPVVNFSATPTEGVAPLRVVFDGSASTDVEGIASYQWDFGDGSKGSGERVEHIYKRAGTYYARLRVIDSSGFSSEQTVTILVAPSAFYKVAMRAKKNPARGSFAVDFEANSHLQNSAAAAGNVSYTWDFGDGKRATGARVFHEYSGPGPFTVTVVASDDQGNRGEAERTLQNLGERQTSQAKDFCLGSAGKALPVLIQFDARCGGVAEGETPYWEFADGDLEFEEIAFRRFTTEGSHPVSLYSVNANGLDVLVKTRNLDLSGERGPVGAEIRALDKKGRKGYGGYYFYIDDLPNTIKFSAENVRSEKGEIASYKWRMGGKLQTGEETYFTITEGGDHRITLEVADEHGNRVQDTIIVRASRSCPWGTVAGICPYFNNYKNHVIPISKASWTLKTTLESELGTKEEHARQYPHGWIRLRSPYGVAGDALSYDLSAVATISGSDVEISKADLDTLNVDYARTYTLEVDLIDEDGNTTGGEIKRLRFGIGKATLVFGESDLSVEVANQDTHFYKKIATGATRGYGLSDLALGNYSVLTKKANGKRVSSHFKVTDTAIQVETVTFPQERPPDYSAVARPMPRSKKLEDFLGDFVPDLDSYYRQMGIPDHGPFKAGGRRTYPWWTRRCDGEYPTHLKLFTDKTIDEFDRPDVEHWKGVLYSKTSPEADTGFQWIPRGAIQTIDNQKKLTFLCNISSGSINMAVRHWRDIEGARACCDPGDEVCFDNYRASYERGWSYQTHENEPVRLDFRLREESGTQETSYVVEKSFWDAANGMGFESYQDLIDYFGISVFNREDYGRGYWGPTFTVEVPVSEDFRNPVLRILHSGFETISRETPANYFYACHLAVKKPVVPEVAYFGPYRHSISNSAFQKSLKPGSVESNTKRLKKKGFFPLDVMPQNNVLPGTRNTPLWVNSRNLALNTQYKKFRDNYKFAVNLEMEFQSKGWFGGGPDLVQLTFAHNSHSDSKTITIEDKYLKHTSKKNGKVSTKISLDMEAGGNARKIIDHFNWSKGIKNEELKITGVGRWTYLFGLIDGGKSAAKGSFLSMPSFNLYEPNAYQTICKHGHYSRPIGFGTARFLNTLSDLAAGDDGLKFRCNDISLPFGGRFNLTHLDTTPPPAPTPAPVPTPFLALKSFSGFEHTGHQDSRNLDVRYFYHTQGGQESFSKEVKRKGIINNFKSFAYELEKKYEINNDSLSVHTSLHNKCRGAVENSDLDIGCRALVCKGRSINGLCLEMRPTLPLAIPSSTFNPEYKLASIANFCQVVLSRSKTALGSERDNLCTGSLTDGVIQGIGRLIHWIKINRKSIDKIKGKNGKVTIGSRVKDPSFDIMGSGLWKSSKDCRRVGNKGDNCGGSNSENQCGVVSGAIETAQTTKVLKRCRFPLLSVVRKSPSVDEWVLQGTNLGDWSTENVSFDEKQ